MAQKPSQSIDFASDIFPAEIEEINHRRTTLGQPTVAQNKAEGGPSPKLGLIGLCLSGGGIRSACFNLGVLQAAAECGILSRIDYLSTVSGGGYIGGCLSTILNSKNVPLDAVTDPEIFPLHAKFARSTKQERAFDETGALKHLRENIRYLAPGGLLDLFGLSLILIGGAIADILALLPYPLLAGLLLAGAMVWLGDRSNLTWPVESQFLLWAWGPLAASLAGAMFLGAKISLSASVRRCVVQAVALVFFLTASFSLLSILPHAVTVLSKLFAQYLKAPVNPWFLLLFALILFQASRRVSVSRPKSLRSFGLAAVWSVGPILFLSIVVLTAWWVWFGAGEMPGALTNPTGSRIHLSDKDLNALARAGMVLFPSVLCLFFFSRLMDVNLTSMHGAYRDALSRTFLFNIGPDGTPTKTSRGKLLRTLFGRRVIVDNVEETKLSALSTELPAAPYHLICATLNTRDSSHSILHDRSADFFLFSKKFVGSMTTGYCPTKDLEAAAPWLTLASAIAASGAATAPNMGARSIPQLTFLLSMLNLRLGVWVPNPRYQQPASSVSKPSTSDRSGQPSILRDSILFLEYLLPKARRSKANLGYLVREMCGLLNSKLPLVNVSDGGHLENLGVFELLKRRCSLIIVADAEADPRTEFSGFADVDQYAEIASAEIDIKCDDIEARDKRGFSKSHHAMGTIKYGPGLAASLLYLKSSLTGDEPLRVRQRRTKDRQFPHTSTTNQFFHTQDFEAYRELGHHIASEAFKEHLQPQCEPASPTVVALEAHFRELGLLEALGKLSSPELEELDKLVEARRLQLQPDFAEQLYSSSADLEKLKRDVNDRLDKFSREIDSLRRRSKPHDTEN